MKSLILNRINEKNKMFNVPTDETNAAAFASEFLEGEYIVYKFDQEIGTTDTETDVLDTNVMVKNSTTGEKTYFRSYLKSTVSHEDLFATLNGLTINGVVGDEFYVVGQSSVTLA